MTSRDGAAEKIKDRVSELSRSTNKDTTDIPVVFVCRQGNDSQVVVNECKDSFRTLNMTLLDIKGGLHAWAKHIDPDFPVY